MLKNFKKKIFKYDPFECKVFINKNDAIHDVYPRVLSGIDLFSKYHGRPSKFADDFREEVALLQNNMK